MASNGLQKPTKPTIFVWAEWKQYAFLALVFMLGPLVGRLLRDQWRLVAGVILVLSTMAAIVWSERGEIVITNKK